MARELGISTNYLFRLEGETRQPSTMLLQLFERLERGMSHDTVTRQEPLRLKEQPNESKLRGVPVISMAQAGVAETFQQLPLSWQDQVPTDCPDADAFAVTIMGDSMEKEYKQGDIAIVMPNYRPRHGCLVIAKLKNDGVMFKIYSQPAPGTVRLASYNESLYPPQTFPEQEFHWIFPIHSVIKKTWR
jgi:phage repressor protein C with HTH and peptisase S24 domain